MPAHLKLVVVVCDGDKKEQTKFIGELGHALRILPEVAERLLMPSNALRRRVGMIVARANLRH